MIFGSFSELSQYSKALEACPGWLKLYYCEKISFHHGNDSDHSSQSGYVQKN